MYNGYKTFDQNFIGKQDQNTCKKENIRKPNQRKSSGIKPSLLPVRVDVADSQEPFLMIWDHLRFDYKHT